MFYLVHNGWNLDPAVYRMYRKQNRIKGKENKDENHDLYKNVTT